VNSFSFDKILRSSSSGGVSSDDKFVTFNCVCADEPNFFSSLLDQKEGKICISFFGGVAPSVLIFTF